MARLDLNAAKEMASKGGSFDFSFFSIKSGETKRVRFLYSSIDEVEAYAVHQIQLADGKRKNVNCLRAINEPVQKCPLCAIGNKPRARIYLSLVDESTHELLVWERSAQFLDELEGYFNRYGDLRDCVFDVERKGSGLDTKYNLFFIEKNVIEDKSVLPERPEVFGKLILNKTAEELGTFINTGVLPEAVAPNTAGVERRNIYQQPQAQAPATPNYGQAPSVPSYTDAEVNPWGNNAANNPTQGAAAPKRRNGWN